MKPWGKMWTFLRGKRFWLKLLCVKGQTSLQHHENRDEYVLGLMKVPRGMRHRYTKGIYIELALGKPDEDDIYRHEDDYGREN